MSKVLAKFPGDEFIMPENNQMGTELRTGSLVIFEITPIESTPEAIFLAGKLLHTRKDYQSNLNTISRLLGAENAFS